MPGTQTHIKKEGIATYYSRWRARPDSNRLLPAVLQVRFQKHLLPVLPPATAAF